MDSASFMGGCDVCSDDEVKPGRRTQCCRRTICSDCAAGIERQREMHRRSIAMLAAMLTPALLLSNLPTKEIAPGVFMPTVSIGTWDSGEKGFDAYDIVTKWLNNSFRGIDTALIYLDQPRVAKAIADFGLERKDVFITSKIPGCQGSFLTTQAVNLDLKRLNSSYIDLMLMHSPFGIGWAR